MATIFDVADFFLANQEPTDFCNIFKLQPLCAYAAALTLTVTNHKLFTDPLEATSVGPQIATLANFYKAQGKSPLSTTKTKDEAKKPFSEQELYILNCVNGYYGAFAAHRLIQLARQDFQSEQATIDLSILQRRFQGDYLVRSIKENFATIYD